MSLVRSIAKRIPGLHAAFLWYVERSEKQRLKGKPSEVIFKEIYEENRWNSDESISGPGSTADQTRHIVEKLPALLHELGVKTMLDIPSGDFNWLQAADLSGIDYLGADIVEALVENNTKKYSNENRHFRHLNLLADDLPNVDLIFCRDCLVHFSNDDVKKALSNVVRSGSTYLLTTSFVEHSNERDIMTGQWRPLNLLAQPFALTAPDQTINENCTEGLGHNADKSLCLWRIDAIAESLKHR